MTFNPRICAAITLVACALLLVPTPAGAAVACRAEQGSTRNYWRWRIVDNRRCWYASKERIDKSQLRWAAPPIPEPAEVETVVERRFYTRQDLEQMFPTEPSFEDRWAVPR